MTKETKTDNAREALLPCPFCQCEDVLVEKDSDHISKAGCCNCSATTDLLDWNTRFTTPSPTSVEHGDVVEKDKEIGRNLEFSVKLLQDMIDGIRSHPNPPTFRGAPIDGNLFFIKMCILDHQMLHARTLPTPSIKSDNTETLANALARVKELEAAMEKIQYESSMFLMHEKGGIACGKINRIATDAAAELEAKPTMPEAYAKAQETVHDGWEAKPTVTLSEGDLIRIMDNVQADLPQTWGELANYNRDIARALLAVGAIAKVGG